MQRLRFIGALHHKSGPRRRWRRLLTGTIRDRVREGAASALLAAVAYGLYVALDALVGRSLPGQIISVCGALTGGLTAYAVAVLALRVPEAEQIRNEFMLLVGDSSKARKSADVIP